MENNQKKIIKTLGISRLSKGQQEIILGKFSEVVAVKLQTAAWNRLSDKDKKDFVKVMGESDNEKMIAYLDSHLQNFSGLVTQVTRETVEAFQKQKLAFRHGLR